MEKIIEELGKKYRQKYGFAVFDLKVSEGKNKIILSGTVLTQSQKEEVVKEMEKKAVKTVESKVRILGDPKSKELGWAVVKAEIADLKSRFVNSSLMNDRILERVRATQAAKGEVLRVLLKKDDQLLVQANDLTLGWVNRKDVVLKKESLRRKWIEGELAKPEKLIAAKRPVEKIIPEAEKFLGAGYVLGARGEKGIDCSAFIQLSYRRAFNIILPRHSWDQKKMGKAVEFDKAKTGDLVFMINKKIGTKHVGIFENSTNGGDIIHASSAEGKVVRQDTQKVFKDYELVELRRIIKS